MKNKASYWKINHAGLLAVLFLLTPLPAQAAGAAPAEGCFNLFRRIPGFGKRRAIPSSVKETQKIAGLADEEIKGSVIVDVEGAFSEEFMFYAKKEMGAEEALILRAFKWGLKWGDVPDHFFMQMHPLISENSREWSFMAFHPSAVWQRLGRRFADIVLALSVFGKFNGEDARHWLEQMVKIAKPGGLVIVDVGKRELGTEQMPKEEFESILSQMEASGLISGWSASHVNHRFSKYQFNPLHLHPSVTYRIVTAEKPLLSDGLRKKLRAAARERGVILPFPHRGLSP